MSNAAILRIILPVGLTLVISLGVIIFSGNQSHHKLARPLERLGIDVWRRENCVACHAIYGLGGHIAPDLTNVWRRRGPQYIEKVLRKGSRSMPALDLGDHEINALIQYLRHVDGLGQYPLPALTSPPFGLNQQALE